jgi:hypothetical protein
MYNMAGHVLVSSCVACAIGLFLRVNPLMKSYFLLFAVIVTLAPLGPGQNKHTQDPTLHQHHTTAIQPALKPVPHHKDPSAVHHASIGNVGAPAKNGTDAQLTALEHQQATVHNPKAAPKAGPRAAPMATAKAPNLGTNPPINFTYKAPNANNAPQGGVANGRKAH